MYRKILLSAIAAGALVSLPMIASANAISDDGSRVITQHFGEQIRGGIHHLVVDSSSGGSSGGDATTVPEPGTLALLLAGIGGLAGAVRRRSR